MAMAMTTSATSSISTILLLASLLLISHTAHGRASCPRIGRSFNATKPNGQNLRLDTRGPIGRYSEISGIAFSPKQRAPSGEPLVFGFSDGGAGERIGLWDPGNGVRLRTLQISNWTVNNWDWEAMTIGSCGNTGLQDTCLYIADTGDNTARASGGRRTNRAHYIPRIMKIKEPLLSEFNDLDFIPDDHISILTIDFFHESSPTIYADAEAIFLDHKGWGEGGAIGDLYMVTKWDRNKQRYYQLTRLFKIPPSAWPISYNATSHYSPYTVGYYDYLGEVEPSGRYTYVTDGQLMGNTWRGGEMSFDGTLIGLATTKNSTLFLRCPGTSVADALAAPNAGSRYCRLWDSPTGRTQVEAFAFTPGGGRSLIIPEGNRPRLGWANLDYSDKSIVCPETDPPVPLPPSVPIPPTPLPTSKPTRSPTPSPTLPQSLKPTTTKPTTLYPNPSPSKSPIVEPTVETEPTGETSPSGLYHPALAMTSNGQGNVGLCQADCDSDDQCQEGLICHVRNKGSQQVPGCYGNADLVGDSDEDFCILPPLTLLPKGDVDSSSTGSLLLEACQADCDSNDDCRGNFVCYQRSSSGDKVPGCRGNPLELGDGNEDYCILPTASFTELEILGNGLVGLTVCQADCDKDSDCDGSLLCFQRKLGIDKVPGCTGNANFLGDGTEDFCVHPLSLAAANVDYSTRETMRRSFSDLAIVIVVFSICAFLLGSSLVYLKLRKRKMSTSNTAFKNDDVTIDMRTAVTSLGANQSQAPREEGQIKPLGIVRQMEGDSIERKPTGTTHQMEGFTTGSPYRMAGLIEL